MSAASTAEHIGARGQVCSVGGQRSEVGTVEYTGLIARAHAEHERPRCLCQAEGVEMYVAKLPGAGSSFVVKRMPGTGSLHAPDCASYEPPPEASGLGQVLDSAIIEDLETGETTLKLDFPLLKIAGHSMTLTAGGGSDSVASDGTRLSLRGLLHYLWDQAELTHWQPGFEGKRTWGTVRRHLLQAAESKVARGESLLARLYIPEVFSVEHRDAIIARRTAQWAQAIAAPSRPQPLMLLIGEVKEIVPARYGFKAVVKHVPGQGFALDEQLYRRLGRRFEPELAMWGAADDVHMVTIATFSVAAAGVPTIHELCLMPVTRQWLPMEDTFAKQLVGRLVAEGRRFIKGLRYNSQADRAHVCATLTDRKGAVPMLIGTQEETDRGRCSTRETLADATEVWRWSPLFEPMPDLPT